MLGDGGSEMIMHSVQAGSFTRWNNAKKLHDELNGKGYKAAIHTAIIGDSRFYRVRVGNYAALDDAEEMALEEAVGRGPQQPLPLH